MRVELIRVGALLSLHNSATNWIFVLVIHWTFISVRTMVELSCALNAYELRTKLKRLNAFCVRLVYYPRINRLICGRDEPNFNYITSPGNCQFASCTNILGYFFPFLCNIPSCNFKYSMIEYYCQEGRATGTNHRVELVTQ